MDTLAVVLSEPQHIALTPVALTAPGPADVVVGIEYSGISTGTEKLLWSGRMPHFPGMGYPLVPGYESVGHVLEAGSASGLRQGDAVFVPGANCFGPVRGLFGGAARHLVVGAQRVLRIDEAMGEQGVLFALAATAHHVTGGEAARQPDLIIGHGVLGRLLARIARACGAQPVVWETNAQRRDGALDYAVIDPASDTRRDYRCICDASGAVHMGGADGAVGLLDTLIGRLAPGGEVVLAGFYDEPLSFTFPPAFMREARIRVAAQWQPADLAAVHRLVSDGRLPLSGLITHRADARQADTAYRTAFADPTCLKMVLDWTGIAQTDSPHTPAHGGATR